MYMTREKFNELKRKYSTLLVLDDDFADAMNFVNDLLEAEADAIEKREPTATASIGRLREAAYEVFSILSEVENGEFEN